MTEQEFISKVRSLMNEIGEDETFSLISDDTVKLDQYIKSCIEESINFVYMSCSVDYLPKKDFEVSGSETGDLSSLVIPKDFLRLIAIKMSTWKRGVSKVFPFDSKEYKTQHNEYTTAGVNKPVCVFGYNSTGDVIECFPPGTLEYAFYAKTASIDKENSDLGNLNKLMEVPTAYICASLVYAIFENITMSDKMKATAIELIPKS